MVPVRVESPTGELGALLAGLIDSGADCTLVPARLVKQLGLLEVDRLAFSGVGGQPVRAGVYAARIELGSSSLLARVVAFGDEVILGRDLLNQCEVLLDGPRRQTRLTWPKPPRRRAT